MSEAERNDLNENENKDEVVELPKQEEATAVEEAKDAVIQETQEVLAEPVEIVDSEKNEASAPYEYRWNYAAQKAFDEGEKKKKRKKGAWSYAIVMASAFFLCFAMLAGVLIWYGVTGRDKQAYGGMSASEVSERISPSTVLIYTKRKDGNYSSGTGFFIRSDGYIATNYHVVEQGKEFEVTLYSAKRVSAELVGTSKENDLAILKIKGSRYPAVTFGNSDEVKVGDVAIVVGNPNGAHGAWTTTQGIISSVDRQSTVNNKAYKMFQTDAAVNPGNSGGPLCNDQGEVIGVVTQIMLEQDGTRSEGFGMAIPGNKAKAVLEDILARAMD